MALELPDLSSEELRQHFQKLSPEPLPEGSLAALEAHYRELRRWARRLALVGPGTLPEFLERHYGESLAALPLLSADSGTLLDVGSGAGFPGLVLAAARPRWQAFLVESRERKWAFLSAASRRAGLSCRCLNVRVGPRLPPGLPDSLDVVTMRALRLPSGALSLLVGRLGNSGRLLLWQGGREPELPEGAVITRELPLPGSRERRILAVELRGAPS